MTRSNFPASTLRRTLRGLAATSLFVGALAAHAQTTQPTQTAMAVPSEAAMAAFKRADLDGDGKLSKAECAMFPALAERFAMLDKDGKGFLSLTEFAAAFDATK